MKKKYIFPVEDNDIYRYVSFAKQFPMLDENQEIELIYDYKTSKNQNSLQTLILSYFRLIVSICFKLRNYKIPFSDLIQESIKGFIKAVENFDNSKGKNLGVFARIWIMSTLYSYILSNISIITLGNCNEQKKMFFALRRFQRNTLPNSSLVALFGKQEAQKFTSSLQNVPLEYDNVISDYLSPESLAINQQYKDIVLTAIKKLDDRSQDIIYSRFMSSKKTSLSSLARRYDISIERVRQIEIESINKIRSYCKIK